jgi:asparagine synthase (glutamine-hydrolysing)
MPGIHLCVCRRAVAPRLHPQLLRVLELIQAHRSHPAGDMAPDPGVFLATTGRSDYPLLTIDGERSCAVLEGYVYNANPRAVRGDLESLASRIADGDEAGPLVRQWVETAHGDYVSAIVAPDRRSLHVFNDVLGRLPLYVYRDSDVWLISREVKFIAASMPRLRYDRLGIAQALCFGYTLGDRTLVDGVRRIPAGTHLVIDLETLEGRWLRTRALNFDHGAETIRVPAERAAGQLEERFVECCSWLRRSFADRPRVISLSGGFDSRAVAAGMRLADPDVCSATFDFFEDPHQSAEATVAEEVAQTLGIPWRFFPVREPSVEDMRELVRLKEGMNYVLMASILPFFEELSRVHGPRMVYYTGDGGDKVMYDLRPRESIRTLEALAKTVVRKNSRLTWKQSAALAGIGTDAFREALMERLRAYPEEDLRDRYVHFLYANRLSNWLGQGEDRNRCFFWSASPFMMTPVFDYANRVCPEAKRSDRFYSRFLEVLSPQCAGIVHAGFGSGAGSAKRRWRGFRNRILSRVPSWLRHGIRRRLRRVAYDVPAAQRALLAECMTGCPAVANNLSEERVRRLLAHPAEVKQFAFVLTIAAYIRFQEDFRREAEVSRAARSVSSPT